MDLTELTKIVSRGEDAAHQFKEDVHNIDSLAAEMVAFSNSRGGSIFIGITNHGVLKGLSTEDVQRINQLISNAASQHSPIAVLTENIPVGTRRIVILLTIAEGTDKPYFDHNGVIWLKNGADKRRISSKEELRRMFQENGDLYADEAPVRVGIEALDLNLFLDFFKKVYHTPFPKAESAQLQLLENLNLAKGHRLTLAGLLLFGKEPQLHKPLFLIKAISFAGTKIANQYLDSEDFEGPIVKVFQGALAFIMRNLRKVQNQKSVNSIGDPEIPPLVFEELLVNALIHRDYHILAAIRIFVFSDRIEIISPGHLPNHLTIEKILAGTSIPRNPILISFIAKGLLPYRGLGSGIMRALETWPQIQFVDDRDGCMFKTIVLRVVVETAIAKLLNKSGGGPINAPLSTLETQILELIDESPSLSYEDIAKKLDKGRTTIQRNIQQLKMRGILHRKGSNKKGFWEIAIESLKQFNRS